MNRKKILTFLLAGWVSISAMAFTLHTTTETIADVDVAMASNYKAFDWKFSGYNDEKIVVNWPITPTKVGLRLSYPRNGTVFLTVLDGAAATNIVTTAQQSVLTILRTSLPPSGLYYAEFIDYENTYTDLNTRVIATGKIKIDHSVWENTTQSTWTNPLAGTVIGPPLHTLSDLSGWPFSTSGGAGDLTEVQVSGGNLAVSSGTGPVPIISLSSAQIITASGVGNYLPLAGGTVTGNILLSGGITIDGLDPGGVEAGATADQTGAEIKSAYEAEADAYTDAKNTVFLGLDTAAERKASYVALGSAWTDAKDTIFLGIDTAAERAASLPQTTKGDLLVRNGSVLVRVGVGADDQVLTADDDADSGVKWAAAAGGGSSGGRIWIPATRFGGFDTGSANLFAHQFHQLSTEDPDHELEGTGLHTTSGSAQTGILKCTWAVPAGSSNWASTGCIKIYYWGDDDGTNANIQHVNIYARDGVAAYTLALSDTAPAHGGSANTPYIVSYDVGDLDSSTLTDTMTIAIETTSASSDCLWIHGVLLTYE